MSDGTKTLYLVDGSGYLFRAYHALPPLSTTAGEPTGAVYGVANMLRKLLDEYDPEYVAVVFDAPGKTFRDELFEAYKATRPPMPEDLAEQVQPLKELVTAMGFPLLEVSGVEADDVIGTLIHRARQGGFDVVVSTSDKDLAQLVDDHVSLVNTMTGKWLDPEGVEKKFGVPPERVVDWLALVGDTSDNIPGVPKVGPKTAAKWLNEYGSLDAVIEHAEDIKGKVGESLREHLEQLELSRELARIRTDADLDVKPSELKMGEGDHDALVSLLSRYEFNSWLKQLGADPKESKADSGIETKYETVTSETDFKAWIERLKQAGRFAFDTETTSLDYMDAELVGVSFAVEPGRAAYVPVGHDYPGAPQQLEREQVLEALKPLLEDPDVIKIGQHFKYDMNVLARYGIRVRGLRHDTMLQSYVLNPTATRHDMDSLALKYLDHHTIKYEDVAGKGAKQLTFNQVRLEEAAPYAAEDADVTLRLHETLWPRIEEESSLKPVYEELEIPLVPVLSRMELNGVLVDTDRLAEHSCELTKRMAEVEQKAHDCAGRSFNLGSPKQLQQILFEELEIPVARKTPKGQPSTAEDVLEELAVEHELPRLILDYRRLAKLKSTYTDRLPERVSPRTGRVHTSYHQAVAATGRLSSSDPNLQNIPVRSEEGRRIRQAFVAPEGCVLLAADYSQIELRIMAHLSGDEGLRKAFREGRDIHQATAAEVFGVSEDKVDADQRRAAKAINFGLIYGMSAWGLSRQLGIEREAAQHYVDRYFERYPGVKDYMERTRKLAREQGYVETVFGRRLYLPDIRAGNANRRQGAERAAINAPMQGTAADVIKRAMLALHEWLEGREEEIRMIMQVHDELVFEVRKEAVGAVSNAIRNRMEAAAEMSIPLEVEIGTGANWDEAH